MMKNRLAISYIHLLRIFRVLTKKAEFVNNNFLEQGYFNKIENELNAFLPDFKPSEMKNTNYSSLIELFIFLIFTFTISGAFILFVSSVMYKHFMKKNKRAPFDVPEFLRFCFPKPQYEYDINQLCQKYIES